jgi:hypothetical protein
VVRHIANKFLINTAGKTKIDKNFQNFSKVVKVRLDHKFVELTGGRQCLNYRYVVKIDNKVKVLYDYWNGKPGKKTYSKNKLHVFSSFIFSQLQF